LEPFLEINFESMSHSNKITPSIDQSQINI